MSRRDFGTGVVGMKAVKLEDNNPPVMDHNKQQSKPHPAQQDSREDRTSSTLSSGQSGTSALDHDRSIFDDTSPSSTSPISYAPLCRQFWKANKYDEGVARKPNLQSTLLSEIIYIYIDVVICSSCSFRIRFMNYLYNFTCGYF